MNSSTSGHARSSVRLSSKHKHSNGNTRSLSGGNADGSGPSSAIHPTRKLVSLLGHHLMASTG